jgi:hypothetical protein
MSDVQVPNVDNKASNPSASDFGFHCHIDPCVCAVWAWTNRKAGDNQRSVHEIAEFDMTGGERPSGN